MRNLAISEAAASVVSWAFHVRGASLLPIQPPADQVGCHIITVTSDILRKLHLIDRSLEDYSRETVKMFVDDAAQAGFSI